MYHWNNLRFSTNFFLPRFLTYRSAFKMSADGIAKGDCQARRTYCDDGPAVSSSSLKISSIRVEKTGRIPRKASPERRVYLPLSMR